jgi:hypothetical protein
MLSHNNYRTRITINLENIKYKQYTDNITDIKLLDFINEFIIISNKFAINMCNCTFQKSQTNNLFGVIADLKDLNMFKLKEFSRELNCHIFGVLYEDIIYYFTNDTQFIENKMVYSINGFCQVSPQLTNFCHTLVNSLIDNLENKLNFFGLGGESFYYYLNNKNKFDSCECYTNSIGVHTDNLTNNKIFNDKSTLKLINYTNYKFNILNNTFCLINISRNGLKNLAEELLDTKILEIVYIGCSKKSMDKDIKILNKKYNIIKQYYFNQGDNILIISHLKKREIISIGSNCSVAYQLQQNNYRYNSYPFDWLKIDNLTSIIMCLKDNFKDFIPNKDIVKYTDKFPLITNDNFPINNDIKSSNVVITNKYNMTFCHDFNENLENYDLICEKYKKRIHKFINNLTIGCDLIYHELKPKKLNKKDIDIIIDFIKNYNNRNTLTIIINNPKNIELEILNYKKTNLNIINDTTQFDSWKKNNFKWNKLFYLL